MNNLWLVASVHFVLLKKAIMKGWNAFYIRDIMPVGFKDVQLSNLNCFRSAGDHIRIVIKFIFQVTSFSRIEKKKKTAASIKLM